MSNTSKESIILSIRSDVEQISENTKQNKNICASMLTIADQAQSEIGFNDPDFIRILDALDSAIEKFTQLNQIREAGAIVDKYLDFLEDMNNIEDFSTRAKKASLYFFEKRDEPTYYVIAEDIVNRTSDFLEDADRLDELGKFMIDSGKYLHKRRNYEQSVSYYERGLNFYIDSGKKDQVQKELTNILEIARNLAIQNNENARLYIELANRVSKDAKIDMKNEPNAQLAYQSYAEHLLKTSKDMVDARVPKTGRLHKKKRNFTDLFQKKDKDSEYL